MRIVNGPKQVHNPSLVRGQQRLSPSQPRPRDHLTCAFRILLDNALSETVTLRPGQVVQFLRREDCLCRRGLSRFLLFYTKSQKELFINTTVRLVGMQPAPSKTVVLAPSFNEPAMGPTLEDRAR